MSRERRLELKKVGTCKISERGGSLQITIPKQIVKLWNLNKGDELTFLLHESDSNYVFLMKERPEAMVKLPPLAGEETYAVYRSLLTNQDFERLVKRSRKRKD